MYGNAVRIALLLGAAITALPAQETGPLLDDFLSRMKEELAKLPDYVCTQTVKRMSRAEETRSWESMDQIRMDVALVGDSELYGKPGAKTFEKRPVAQWAGQGAFSTGKFGSLAKHLFLGGEARFEYRGESERNGRKAHEYAYDVAPERSSYRLRAGASEDRVGFQGAFWIDAESRDLLELEVQAYDIPESLGLAEASTILSYRRIPIGEAQVLLPVMATLELTGADGGQNRNITRIDSCRQYGAESSIRFAVEAAPTPSELPAETDEEDFATAAPGVIELQLEEPIDPSKAAAGAEIRARVSKAAKGGNAVLIPAGTLVYGRLVRVDRQGALPVYDVAMEFDSIENGAGKRPFAATLERTGPGPGLVRQSKKMMPNMRPGGRARMTILVSEVRQGQGVIVWDVRKGPIPRGFRMKWRVDEKEWSGLLPARNR
jgi:hypothetical protein